MFGSCPVGTYPQVPLPSQILQRPQLVPAGYRWHPPLPSHRPLVPQLVAPWSVQSPPEAPPAPTKTLQLPLPSQLRQTPQSVPAK